MCPFELNEVFAAVREMMEVRAANKGILLEMTCPPITVTSDPARLRQVLINMVGNALKFTERGSVKVSVNILHVADKRPRLQFEITDTGIGMSPETQAKLFQDFQQGDPSISRRFGGTGLGLAICKKLVIAMGGNIEVSSIDGVGTTFRFDVPCQGDAASAQTAAAKIVYPARYAGRVLVVEDNPINRQVAERLLTNIGMDVEVVENGALAVSAVKSKSFSLVFMDMQMPVMDGLTATRAIREAGLVVPIVGLTANAFASDREDCLAAGMNGFISKPVTRAKLEAAIAEFAAVLPESDPNALPDPEPMEAAVDTSQRDALVAELGADQYEALLDNFIEDASELFREFERASDPEAQVRAMHSLKGMAWTLGLTAIGDAAATSEEKLRKREAADVERLERLVENLAHSRAPLRRAS